MEIPKLSIFKIPEDLQTRIISASILAPLVLIIIFLGGILYNLMILAATIIMSFEWKEMTSSKSHDKENFLNKWNIIGFLYLCIFGSSLIYLRSIEGGFGIILLMLFTVWATDISAFFTGKMLQGPKIYPKISPNKTWSGLLGGMVAAGFIGVIASTILDKNTITFIILGMLLAIIAQIGDFFESWVKRTFGVKDSSNLIPGHGGLMDRLDGFTTVAPIFVIITKFI